MLRVALLRSRLLGDPVSYMPPLSFRILVKAMGRDFEDSIIADSTLGLGGPGEENIGFLMEDLGDFFGRGWVDLDAYARDVRGRVFLHGDPVAWVAFQESDIIGLQRNRILQSGTVELGAVPGRQAWRLTTLGAYLLGRVDMATVDLEWRNGKRLVVSPNLEVAAFTTETDPRVLLKLAMFARPVGVDMVSQFQITEESIGNAVGRGFEGEDIIEFLEKNSSGALPQNVSYTVLDWARG